MLKLFGYGDKLREGFFNKPSDIELLSKNDYRTAYDINRPLKNIYEGVEQLNDFLNVFSNWKLTDNGVFPNSLGHEFAITSNNVVKVTLLDKTPIVPTSVTKVYTKLAPGIAGVNHADARQDSMVVVHRPNINLLERQLEYILGLFYYDESESVELKWHPSTNNIKALVKAKAHPEDPIEEIQFGGDWYDDGVTGINSIELLADMYNHNTLNARFVNAVGPDLTKLLLEPMFEITSTGTYYWEIVDGEVVLTTTGTEGFLIGQFDITDLATITIENIQQLHRRYGKNVKLEIFGTEDDSYDVSTNGGIVYNIGKGIHIENSAGALIEINQLGDITINSAPGRDLNFGGVNILGIQANVINTTSVFNQDGTMNIDATGAGEEFNTDAETHNQTAETQNNTIETKNDTIVTEVRNISGTQEETIVGKKTINANTELEINTPLLDENITDKTLNATTETNVVTTKSETIETLNETIETRNENVTGKKTLDVDTELEINTPLLDKNITTETENTTTKTSVIANKNETITNETRDVTSVNETIETEVKEVTGNKTETIGINSTETVVGTKESNADAQRINAIADIILSAPSITLDAGETGTIHIIGEQQTIEGETVRLEDNIIELNKNQTGIPSSGLFSGVEVNRGTQSNAQVLFRESDDTWINGIVGNLKAIANREDNNAIIDDGIPSWDSVTKMFLTDGKLKHNRGTGTLTVNVTNAGTVPPFSTNSTMKVANLNVDRVDNVHVNNSGAAANEIAMWTGADTIGTANKTFVTTIASNDTSTDAQIPTAQAVSKFAVMLDSIAVENYSKGIRITYGNGEGALGVRTAQLANWNVDKVDGVDINSSGAANGELAVWTGPTTIGTADRTIGTAISAIPVDTKIPTEKAVRDFINGRTFSIAVSGDVESPLTINLSPDGSGNFSGSFALAVKDDSHTHNSIYYTETESDTLFLKKVAAAQTITGDLDITGVLSSSSLDVTNNTTIGGNLDVTGDITGASVYGAVWNDLAELFPKSKDTQPGDVVMMTPDGVAKCNEKNSKLVVGVHSDSYGFLLGRELDGKKIDKEEESKKTPIGLSGRVWVKMNTTCKQGDLLISGKDGFAIVKKWYHFGQGNIIGKSMENKNNTETSRVEMKIMG